MDLPRLPPPPPEIPPHIIPMKVEPTSMLKDTVKPKGSRGKRVAVITNHFKVTIDSALSDFYHYTVSISYENGCVTTQKNIRLAVIDKLCDTYKSQLTERQIFYDGARALFASGPLPENNIQFSVVLNDVLNKGSMRMLEGEELCGIAQKKRRVLSNSELFKVEMKFVCVISMQSLKQAVRGERLRDDGSLRVLDAGLRQQAAKQGCLVVRQSYFSNDLTNFVDLGGGVLGCKGFSSSFRALQGGLYLNHDVSMTTIVQPGSVIDFLIANQSVKTPFEIDWTKANQTLKNLRIKVNHLKSEFKISGISARSCKEEKFSMKMGESILVTTVYDYFVNTKRINLTFSANLPCINAGKHCFPILFPIELCSLVPLQRKTNELTVYQKSAMIRKFSHKPEDLIKILGDAVKMDKYNIEPILKSCGVLINKSLVQTEGRILPAPRLKLGNGEYIIPRNGFWTIKDKRVIEPKKLEYWAVVNFSTQCNVHSLCERLAKLGSSRGMVIKPPLHVFQENLKHKNKPPSVRVDMMFLEMQSQFRKDPPHFILCILFDKKSSYLYGPWKKKTLIECGVLNQCLIVSKFDDNYLMNVLLKINAKLGGFNHVLVSESTRSIPLVGKKPTMIIGMDISHASSAGPPDGISIASVVGSREWPKISSYKASLRALPPKASMIDSLFKPISQKEDTGIMRELLLEFYTSSGQQKPAQIIIFRNGLSSSEFHQVLNAEIDQILKACKFIESNWRPKLTVIVAQRKHHTKFFDADSGGNVKPGTIIDNKICDVEFSNFYMCPHASWLGTARSIHYHVLLDEIGFSSDDLQELVHCLSYVFQRCNKAISEVSPVRYARLAAAQMLQMIKPDKRMNSSENGGGYGPGYQLPKLHKNVSSSMFFC